MSKKLASGADKIVIDLKVGKGALMTTKKQEQNLYFGQSWLNCYIIYYVWILKKNVSVRRFGL